MKVEVILVSRGERHREKGGLEEISACPVSSKTLTIMWCLIYLTLNSSLIPSTLLSSLSFYHVSHLLINRKTQGMVQPEKVLGIKEWNIGLSKPVLSIWFIQPSTCFYHTIRFTTINHLYIYIYMKQGFCIKGYWFVIKYNQTLKIKYLPLQYHSLTNHIYKEKHNLAINTQQGLICH